MNRDYQRAYLAAIKNQPEYWKRHYASAVTTDGGTLRDSPLLGAELITNGTFDTNIIGWNSALVTTSFDNGRLKAITTGVGTVRQTLSVKPNTEYSYIYFCESTLSTIRTCVFNNSNATDIFYDYKSTGKIEIRFTTPANCTSVYVYLLRDTPACTAYFDFVSLKELAQPSFVKSYYKMARENNIAKSIQFAWLGEGGIKNNAGKIEKAYSLVPQIASTKRNLLTYTEEFDNAAWNTGGNSVAITPNTIANPFGVNSADTITAKVATYALVYQSTPSITNGDYITLSCYVKAGTRNFFGLAHFGLTDVFFDLVNLTYNNISSTGFVSASIIDVGNGWRRLKVTWIKDSNSTKNSYLVIASSLTSQGGLVANTDYMYIWGAQLEVGSTATEYQRVLEANNYDGSIRHATQTTAGSRPYLSGNIAPNEKLGLKNPNRGSNFMTHPTISFAANESWSVTTVLNWNGGSPNDFSYAGGGYRTRFTFDLNTQKIGVSKNDDLLLYFDSLNVKNVGKNSVVTITKIGDNISLFINGVFKETKLYTNASFVFQNILAAWSSFTTTPSTIKSHIIRSQALIPTQVTAEYDYLRSVYPEMESVSVGVETEKVTNQADREFSSDTGFWQKQTGWSISGGVANYNGSGGNWLFLGVSQGIKAATRYRVTFTIINYVSGNISVGASAYRYGSYNANGTYIVEVGTDASSLFVGFISSGAFNGAIDNVSVVELPQTWTTSNCEMAATPQGNVIQEMQAAANVEKITNIADREFSSDTGFWTKNTWTIENGTINANNLTSIPFYRNIGLAVDKYYKVTYTISNITAGSFAAQCGTTLGLIRTANGTYTDYLVCAGNSSMFWNALGGFTGSIDNISVQEIGWSGSQELYDGIYAQTAEAASSVEKITNAADRDFSSDTGWWTKGSNVTIGSGTANFAGGISNYISRNASIVTGKYYKMSITVTNYVSGTLIFKAGSGGTYQLISANGTYNYYSLCNSGTYIELQGSSDFIASVDNVSVKELGLSDATSIANYTYAAVKAAGFWKHYSNSVDNGAIYGKEYNGYAKKLLQMDIDYYNVANPTALWGWRVPTQADFQTLSTYLGGDSVSGGKLKKEGTAYWSTPNTGADNSSGFSALPNGIIWSTSGQSDLTLEAHIGGINGAKLFMIYNDSRVNISGNANQIEGTSLRLIKA